MQALGTLTVPLATFACQVRWVLGQLKAQLPVKAGERAAAMFFHFVCL
jgi:hypothetical protein